MPQQSLVSRYRQFLGRRTFTALLPPAILLALLLLIVKWLVTPSIPHGSSVWIADEPGFEFKWMDDIDIKAEIEALQDLRKQECKRVKYDKKISQYKVSILLTFHEHEFNNLKTTLESIVMLTPDRLYDEILLLDDGSVRDSVRKEAAKLLTQDRFKKVRGYRSEKVDGTSLSRFKASKVANGEILVFLSTKVVVNTGWLEPLLEKVINEPTVLAVPHIDRLLKGPRFIEVKHGMVNVFGWTLTTYYRETETSKLTFNTPVMTGDAFAANRQFLDDIGSYDDGMESGNGETLELSLRTWMCGGSIQVVSCSRVAAKDALLPHNITSDKNFDRIATLWFSHDYQRVINKHHTSKYVMNVDDQDQLDMRQKFLQKTTQCQDIDWYMEGPGRDIARPANLQLFYNMGKLGNAAGVCVHGTAQEDGLITADLCRPHIYDPEMIFEHDMSGMYRHKGKCIEYVSDNESLRLNRCDKNNKAQFWVKHDHDMIFNMEHRDYCLTHKSQHNSYRLHTEKCIMNPKQAPPQSYRWHIIQY